MLNQRHTIEVQAESTIKSGYLAYAPDGSTTETYALDNKTRGLASSILLNPPPIMMPFDFNLELTVKFDTAGMHDIATYVLGIWYVTRRMLAEGRISSF